MKRMGERTVFRKKPKRSEEIMAVPRGDRRTLGYVPDPEHLRVSVDRRGRRKALPRRRSGRDLQQLGQRYIADFSVTIGAKGHR
ncbi:hypothetical protein D3C76_1344800 [compost metagenome]